MRILIIRTFPDALNLKSYNVQEVGLAKALIRKGHVCDIVLYNGKKKDRKQEYHFSVAGEAFSFTIHWLKGYNFFRNGLMPSVKKLIPEYDVIQVHEYDQILSWDIYTRQPKPAIIYHGPYYDEFARGYNFKCKVFDLLFLPRRKYRDVVAITKSTLATDFLKNKGFRNVTTVGVGINPDNFGACTKGEADLDQTAFAGMDIRKSLLYVGKLEERRNLYFLVEVFRKLRQKDSTLKLTIIGNGEAGYKDGFLSSIGKDLAEGSIEYRERADQTELVEYYHNASFFVLASNYEIFGMVLLEAMYFGVPVISSVNGGSCTLIKNGYNGFVMEGFDSEAWAGCLEKAMQDEGHLNELKKNARKTVEESFTWDALADKFIEAYRQAINGAKGV